MALKEGSRVFLRFDSPSRGRLLQPGIVREIWHGGLTLNFESRHHAVAPSPALSEFTLLASLPSRNLRTRGELIASDFAEVQGLSLTLRAFLSFGAPEIHYVPEPSSLAGLASGVALLMLLALSKLRGVSLVH